MQEDSRVRGRSNEEVRGIANRAKSAYGVDRIRPVNILRCLQRGSVETLYGRKSLLLVVLGDEELGAVDAKTEFVGGTVTITCKRSVEQGAFFCVHRDRMTLAHELGHAIMHSGEPKYRYAGASGTTPLSETKAYESAEHQAKEFGSAFLIHDIDAAKMNSAEEIAEEFVVSLEAATICFKRLARKAERARSAARVMKIAEELKATLLGSPKPRQSSYLDVECLGCNQKTLLPNGPNNVSCDTCGFRGPRYQDGDEAA
jgi:hypothetical protein